MLKIIQKRLSVELSEEEASHLQQTLQTRYNSLLYRIRLEYLNRLGLSLDSYKLTSPPSDADLFVGEVFMPEPGTVLYLKGVRGSGILEAGIITNDSLGDFFEFFADVRDALYELRGDVPSWETPAGYCDIPVEDAVPGFQDIQKNTVLAARAMLDIKAHDLLERINKSGSIFAYELNSDNRDELNACISTFKRLGLLNMHYIVLCRRNGQQLLRVPDKKSLEDQKALSCWHCNSPLSEERVEEVLACTEACTQLLKDNEWFLVLLQSILADNCIAGKDLKIYRTAGQPIQIVVPINGQRYLFVLCTDTLDLDQANLLGAHISAYHLDHAVVISTVKISTIMRRHLSLSNPHSCFHFVEDLHNLDSIISTTLRETQKEYLEDQLQDLAQVTPINISQLVLHRLLPAEEPEIKEEEVAETISAEPVAAEPMAEPEPAEQAPAVNAEEPELKEEEAVAEPEPEAEPEPAAAQTPAKGSGNKRGKRHK